MEDKWFLVIWAYVSYIFKTESLEKYEDLYIKKNNPTKIEHFEEYQSKCVNFTKKSSFSLLIVQLHKAAQYNESATGSTVVQTCRRHFKRQFLFQNPILLYYVDYKSTARQGIQNNLCSTITAVHWLRTHCKQTNTTIL